MREAPCQGRLMQMVCRARGGRHRDGREKFLARGCVCSGLANFYCGGYAGSMFDGLSKREIIGWLICLALALGLTVFGSVYWAASLMSADVTDALKQPHRSSNQNFR
jgi:hypothetical protein